MGLLKQHGQIGSSITNNTTALKDCQDEDSPHDFPIEHIDDGRGGNVIAFLFLFAGKKL